MKRFLFSATRAPQEVPSEHIVSGVLVFSAGGHEVVRVWNRGGLAGELCVSKGDGVPLAKQLFSSSAEHQGAGE